ncbi:DUF4870 family protein [Desulfohalobium retbaense]|uniref:Transmembrane protein n=1 Tax=Desulfohalobium retbaense (strain ATCC 49708 / DSM 5692 / JCM 16813 / HR100) TaxID=485915 RepID=C8X5R8_DESRD|nr:membrane protein [Desulfohalobium retbaense]ACV69765.1 transmembrane protein [Desulfohalobium retbaense DSM 5692]
MAFSGGRWETIPDRGAALQTSRKLTWLTYILYAASPVFGITAIVAIVLNYIKKDDVKGTWLESHFRWQIRTFWWGLLWISLGSITAVVFIGIPILFAATVWLIYRVVKGMVYLYDERVLPLP